MTCMAMVNAKQLKLLDELQSIDKTLKQFNRSADRRKEYKDRVEAKPDTLSRTEPYNSGKTSGWDTGPWPWQVFTQT